MPLLFMVLEGCDVGGFSACESQWIHCKLRVVVLQIVYTSGLERGYSTLASSKRGIGNDRSG
jgi:hypothetical protein